MRKYAKNGDVVTIRESNGRTMFALVSSISSNEQQQSDIMVPFRPRISAAKSEEDNEVPCESVLKSAHVAASSVDGSWSSECLFFRTRTRPGTTADITKKQRRTDSTTHDVQWQRQLRSFRAISSVVAAFI
mmetsp:Transcript_34383/g.75266  ORF Transcript_34383/g.75266 Transcript_34383/m.75266 type:complete len:131 (-) Transcript_34383:273-665(-)